MEIAHQNCQRNHDYLNGNEHPDDDIDSRHFFKPPMHPSYRIGERDRENDRANDCTGRHEQAVAKVLWNIKFGPSIYIIFKAKMSWNPEWIRNENFIVIFQ
ncbi:hypothetical protein D3C85_945360 [compost metagenome]